MARTFVKAPEHPEERFLKYVGWPDKNGCHRWLGHVSALGYGRFNGGMYFGEKKPKTFMAHRWAYEYFVGKLLSGMTVDHLCRNRACVNPWHLGQVTQRENTLRGIGFAAINAKKTQCIRGHYFTEENTYRYIKNGTAHRECRICRSLASKKACIRRMKGGQFGS